ncbi:MAG TPA: hypothetical protein VFB03_00145, partial [Candidatus Saccharimonadales bacterium]|nr:hypothetical protein [Candidatus Saccharimonadales bacterium]
LLVGSLGRAAIYKKVFDHSDAEITAMGQSVTSRGQEARDIDYARLSIGYPRGPFMVDIPFRPGNLGVNLTYTDEVWVLSSKGFEERLSPSVMEPIAGETVYGAPCMTVHPQTHLALVESDGVLREPQDRVARHLLLKALDAKVYPEVPTELYEPFERLRELRASMLSTKFRQLCVNELPEPVRRHLRPIIIPVWQRLFT